MLTPPFFVSEGLVRRGIGSYVNWAAFAKRLRWVDDPRVVESVLASQYSWLTGRLDLSQMSARMIWPLFPAGQDRTVQTNVADRTE